jgi:hypothetical protein
MIVGFGVSRRERIVKELGLSGDTLAAEELTLFG